MSMDDELEGLDDVIEDESVQETETPARRRRAREVVGEPETIQDDDHKVFGLGIENAEVRQPAYGQGIVISLLCAGAVLFLAIIAIGEETAKDPPILDRTDTIFWLVSAFILLLAAGGAQFAEFTASRAAAAVGHPPSGMKMATAWAVPLVSAVAAVMLVGTFHNKAMLACGPLIAFFGTAGALLSRDLLDEADDQSHRVASVIHTLVVHIIAFLAFSAVYLNKLDSIISAPLVGVLAAILIVETLERGGIAAPQRVFYAMLGGFVMAQATAALDWWPSYGWTGGAVLLVLFYVAAGLLLVKAQKREVQTRDLVEFGGVGGAFLLLLAFLA